MRGHYWIENHDGGWALLMIVMMIFLLVGVAAVVMLVIRSQRRSDQPQPNGLSASSRLSASGISASVAEQVLAERFARGEIDGEEYRARLAVLRGSGT
jgi:putative membrane protein